MTNYLDGQNPHMLKAPPVWFMRQLALFDPDLVILPGLSEPVYRLARRVRRSNGLMKAAMGLDTETARMITLRVVPVTSIMPFVEWGPQVFQWLNERDVWAAGGSTKADLLIADNDAEAKKKMIAAEHDEARQRAGAAWRGMAFRHGRSELAASPAGAEYPVNAGTGG